MGHRDIVIPVHPTLASYVGASCPFSFFVHFVVSGEKGDCDARRSSGKDECKLVRCAVVDTRFGHGTGHRTKLNVVIGTFARGSYVRTNTSATG